MRTLVVAVSAAGLALASAACGGGGAQSAGPVPIVPAVSSEALTFELWFTGDHRSPPGRNRTVPGYTGCCAVDSTARTADELGVPHRGTEFAIGPHVFEKLIEALLAGPTPDEVAYGFKSEISADTLRAQGRDPIELLGVSLDKGIVTVDFSSEWRSPWRGRSELFQLAQVVYTVTQFPEVEGVRFKLDGRPLLVPTQEDPSLADTVFVTADGTPSAEPGQLLDRPVTRKDYERALPTVTYALPMRGAEVTSPAHIVGTVTKSARVRAVVVDVPSQYPWQSVAGTVLGERVATLTCRTEFPCDYEIDVPFDVSKRQSAFIELHPDDSLCSVVCPPHVIPVTLVP